APSEPSAKRTMPEVARASSRLGHRLASARSVAVKKNAEWEKFQGVSSSSRRTKPIIPRARGRACADRIDGERLKAYAGVLVGRFLAPSFTWTAPFCFGALGRSRNSDYGTETLRSRITRSRLFVYLS